MIPIPVPLLSLLQSERTISIVHLNQVLCPTVGRVAPSPPSHLLWKDDVYFTTEVSSARYRSALLSDANAFEGKVLKGGPRTARMEAEVNGGLSL